MIFNDDNNDLGTYLHMLMRSVYPDKKGQTKGCQKKTFAESSDLKKKKMCLMDVTNLHLVGSTGYCPGYSPAGVDRPAASRNNEYIRQHLLGRSCNS